jgi:hypothetical protein
MKLTNQQITELAAIRTQHDLNENNFGSNHARNHELVNKVDWHGAYKALGLTMQEAEEITWPVIWNEMQTAMGR